MAPTRAGHASANVAAMSTHRIAEAERLAGDLIRFGVVAGVDLDAGLCAVDLGDIRSGPLPWFAGRAGADVQWDPPSVGEQCVVLCAEGDLEAGLVLAGVYSTAVRQRLGDALGRAAFVRRFRDGAVLSYDPEAHQLVAELPAGGSARLVAPGGLDLVGPLRVAGDVEVEGKLTASADVVGQGVSLAQHQHGGVQPGGGVSGGPVP